MAESNIPEKRAQIIKDVTSNGLRPSAYLREHNRPFVGSNDQKDHPVLSGAIFHYSADYSIQRRYIEDSLYRAYESSMPVLLERPWDTEERELSLMSVESQELFNQRLSSGFFVMSRLDRIKNPLHVAYVDEGTLSWLLFPDAILNEYLMGGGYFSDEVEAKITIVSETVSRKISFLNPDLLVPNYEDMIMKIIGREKTTLWGHVVTLPIQEDAAFI